ncbi:MAG: hypothetical protein RIS84_187 [Pseudomonadota bacterium]|jgi:molybdate transport system regulatory protein
MNSSARNQFLGTISTIKQDSINAEVIVTLPGGVKLTSLVTLESVTQLDLAVGKEVYALVKASQIILLTDLDMKVTARNNLAGVVKSILQGKVNAEVVLELEGGQLLKATVTEEALEEMKIELGKPLRGAFKANSVLLAIK